MYGVVTGATSGIGLAFSKYLAKNGYDVVMIGRRKEKLEIEADLLEKNYKIKTKIIISDLSDKNQLSALIDMLEDLDNKQEIAYFVNNAGFGLSKDFFDDNYSNQENMLAVHINALSQLTHFVAGKMMKRKTGNIINVASMAGFMPLPRSPFYSASKAFINTFTESIYPTLKINGVNIQSLCPGFTKTDFHSRLNLDRKKLKKNIFVRWMSADKVVELSMKNIKKPIYIPGISNKFLLLALKLIPKAIYYKFSLYLSREYKKMNK